MRDVAEPRVVIELADRITRTEPYTSDTIPLCDEAPCQHQQGLEKLVQALAIASGTTVTYVRWQYGLDPA